MFILGIKEKCKKYNSKKTVIIYILVTIFAFVVNKVYALFGHGVSSDSMTWMFLYPLIGGAVLFLLLGFLFPELNRFIGYRIFFNLYNSGIAVLTVGSLLKGIMEIAGTSSSYLTLYYISGYVFVCVSFVLLLLLALNYRKIILLKY